ncbi:MAG: hypothetical protein JNK82_27640 [Myxococcaceae bacterium]|nr:hypothetical protein [Myxococcaceae bacterium]
MPKVTARSVTKPKPAAAPTKVTAATVTKLKKATVEALKSSTVTWSRTKPAGVQLVRVPLIKGKTDQYSFTALVPAKGDPNKAKVFVLERSGGFAGLTEYSTPLNFSGKPAKPLFDKLLTNQKKADYANATERYPSDVEDGGAAPRPKPGNGGGVGVTERYPSDNEDVGGTRPRPGSGGGSVGTERYPSDVEDTGGSRPRPGGVTERYPSDSEDVGGGGGSIATERYPSDSD